jgi:glycerophosphoryl diester phosphodiesterase
MFVVRLYLIVLGTMIAGAASGAAPLKVVPLSNAHAHNDYLHARPLLDSLDHGFISVEADVFLVDGKLLVGHERDSLKSERTLESLYLDPLAARVEENGGRIYKNGPRFLLLIDFKSEARTTYGELHNLLAKYAKMLTVIENGKVREGAVTVVVSGDRPKLNVTDAGVRYVGVDGRPSDLESQLPAHFMPMISDKWSNIFTWEGESEMPASERAKLVEMVKKAHAAGRVVRFWATPEKEAVWRELRAAGVDLINTDELEKLETFLNVERCSCSLSAVRCPLSVAG